MTIKAGWCLRRKFRRLSQVVRQRSAKPPFSGSNPEAASKKMPAQSLDFAGLFFYNSISLGKFHGAKNSVDISQISYRMSVS